MRIFWPAMAEDLVELQFSSQWSRERRFAAHPPGSTNETNAVEGGKTRKPISASLVDQNARPRGGWNLGQFPIPPSPGFWR